MPLTSTQVRELRQTRLGASGNRVAKAIALIDETVAEISRNAHVPYTWLTDVKAGRFETVTVANAHKLAAYFGCSIEDLFPAREERVSA